MIHGFKQARFTHHFYARVYRISLVVLLLLMTIVPVWAQEPDTSEPQKVYLPLIAGNSEPSFGTTPLHPDLYDSQAEPPTLAEVQSSTVCSTWIRFSNQSSQTIKVYWRNYQGQEVLYKTLSPNTSYWQQTYYGLEWRIRSASNTLIKTFIGNSCYLMYVVINNNDFPQPTATPNHTPTSTPAQPGALGGRVWEDTDSNGVRDGIDGDAYGLLADIQVQLLDGNNNLLATTQTATDGAYGFNNLGAGTYKVQFVLATLPVAVQLAAKNVGSDPTLDSDADPATGLTDAISLTGGQTKFDVDLGLHLIRSILGDRVWYDNNGNGIQESNEPGVPNVTVELQDADGRMIGFRTTGGDGSFRFGYIPSGDYILAFDLATLPAGYIVTISRQGGDADYDSDVDPTTGETPLLHLNPEQINTSIDMGIVQPQPRSTIGDLVWFDNDRDGIRDDGELGVTNVVVNLLDPVGFVLATTTSDTSGQYQFTNIYPGNYKLAFDLTSLPVGYIPTLAKQGVDDNVDSDADIVTGATAIFNLAPGIAYNLLDLGIVQSPELPKLGDRVWFDLNSNGLQEPGEGGAPNVSVNLLDANGNLVANQVTDGNGAYLFSNITPGLYKVQFDLATLPAGYNATTANVAYDISRDSDPNPITGVTPLINLVQGEVNRSIDLGISQNLPKSIIGDRVWFDNNRNGSQDASENGVANVSVKLLDTNGNVVLTRVTGASGLYQLIVNAGAYQVVFDTATLPAGYQITAFRQGSDANFDSDADPVTGAVPAITLALGQSDLTLDMGIFSPSVPTPTSTPTGPTATPTNTPTATNTPNGPTATATSTALPPTATPTNTAVPPTATPTNTPVPPTATPTNTAVPPTATPTSSAGTGTGLTSHYFNNVTLDGSPVLQRVEAVNFELFNNAPATGVAADDFSVRWFGQVEAPVTGGYQFQTLSDDGVRLWVNGVQLINNWTDHAATTDTSVSINLTAGTKYNIVLEFYERGGYATAKLLWKLPATSAFVIVPANRLYALTNVAQGKSVSASSTAEIAGLWSRPFATDGIISAVNKYGWSSNNNLTANHSEWVMVDLGSNYAINQIGLAPRRDGVNAGYGFPIDFTIQFSTDNVNWSTVVNRTGYPKPDGTIQFFNFAPATARYVRIVGTSVRANPNDGNYYRMQFAEILVGRAP